MNKHFSLYIHIPFCGSKCAYCDFISFAGKDEYISAYFDALKKEIIFYAPQFETRKIDTLYIGGGTPSYVSQGHIAELLENINKNFLLSNNCEISMESNPGTLTFEKCKTYKHSGINRMSLGVQAVQSPLLRLLGRAHSFDDVLRSVAAVRSAGFSNLNLDIMFGLPMQTMPDWRDTLKEILALSPEHISAYSLIVEEGTPFYSLYNENIEEDEQKDRDMYHYLCSTLRNKGYLQYEISNFALKEKECRHNLYCWDLEEYLGIGLNAHSFIGSTRFANEESLESYITAVNQKGSAKIFEEELNRRKMIGDYIMLGFRKTAGINLMDFKDSFNEDLMDIFHNEIHKFIEKGLLALKANNLSLTEKGLDYANYVMREFL